MRVFRGRRDVACPDSWPDLFQSYDSCKHPKRGTLDTYFRAWICEPCLKTEFVLELEAQTYLEEGDLNRFTLDCSVTTRGRGYVKIRGCTILSTSVEISHLSSSSVDSLRLLPKGFGTLRKGP